MKPALAASAFALVLAAFGAAGMSHAQQGEPACTELEAALGLSGAACGHLSADAVLRMEGVLAR